MSATFAIQWRVDGLCSTKEAMMFKLASLSILSSVLILPSLALAADQDFKIINKTGYTINEVYVGPQSSNSWGEDIMGSDAVPEGSSVDITFPNSTSACKFDIKVVYDDKDASEFRGVNLCDVSKVTLFWNRNAGETRFVAE